MTFPPSILWDCSGSLDTLRYTEIKLLTGWQKKELFTSLLDVNWPCRSLGRIWENRRNAGLTTSIWQCGGVLSAPRDRLKNWFQVLVWLLRPGYRPLNRTQSRAVAGLLIGHNTLRRHLYVMGLMDSPLCRRRGAEEETSAHVLCECEALASLRHIYFGSFFLDSEDVRSQSLGTMEDVSKGTGFPWLGHQIMGHKGLA